MSDARNIANWFIRKYANEGKTLTVMQLLKLVYISHGWFLEISKGTPMFSNKIEAWQYGPVIPDLYQAVRSQGLHVTQEVVGFSSDQISDEAADVLGQVDKIYGGMSGSKLSKITHVVGGPWDIATKQFGNFAPIPDHLIQAHYEAKRAASASVG